MKTDFHFHSNFSADSKADPRAMVEAAIEKDFSIICFTDHVDIDFPEQLITFDTAEYTKYLDAMREEYKGKIDIRKGVEVGMLPHIVDENDSFVKSAPFDFVIASTHVIKGLRPNPRRFNEYKDQYPTAKEGVVAYLEDVLKNLQLFDNFDVCGHLDYISVYTYEENFAYEEHREITDEILRLLITKGKGLELNTAHYRRGFEGSPCMAVLKRYKELGGEIITTGSDGHSPKEIGFGIDWAQECLRTCGFRYFTVFKDRKPEFLPL